VPSLTPDSHPAARRPTRNWRGDQGAAVILVAIVLAVGMISGLLALVADVGQLYAERRVVQNGADAAALAVAQRSAELPAGAIPGADAQVLARGMADANSPDAVTSVQSVCGTDGLDACPALSTAWTDCQSVPVAVKHFVRVRTATELPGGQDFLTPLFAGFLEGSDDPQARAGACAQSSWGPAASALITFPTLLPVCPGTPEGTPVWIADFEPSDPDFTQRDRCVLDGQSFAGVTKGFAFGSFPGVSKTCVDPVKVSVGDQIPVETSVTQWCGNKVERALDPLIASGEATLVPVVGAHANQGQGQYLFTVLSFKSFTLLGYKVKNATGGQAPSPNWAGTPCHRSAKRSCLYGTFGPAVVTGGVGGGPDLGVRAVALLP
jgi:Flp pilus assembly protein TadG